MNRSSNTNRGRLALAGWLLPALAALGQTTNVVRPIADGQVDLMSVPLVVEGGNAVSNVFASAAINSTIYFWDATLQNWNFSQKTAKDWPGDSRELVPGEAFYFEPAGAQTVVLTGTPPELPFTITVPDQKSMLSVPLPESGIWGHCPLSRQLPPGSTVAFWDRPNGAWLGPFTNAPDGQWENAAFDHVLLAGDGFAVTQPGGSPDLSWTEFGFAPPPAPVTNVVRVLEADRWDLISVPLLTASSNRFASIASNAADHSQALFYDAPATNFILSQKSDKGAWDAVAQAQTILPGKSFFLKSPADREIVLEGTVPVSSVTNQVNARWSALGYPYPEDAIWTDTSLASNLPAGSLVYFWNIDRQQYDVFRKGPPAKGGWGSASNRVIHPGDGFFVRQPPGSAPFLWIQERGN